MNNINSDNDGSEYKIMLISLNTISFPLPLRQHLQSSLPIFRANAKKNNSSSDTHDGSRWIQDNDKSRQPTGERVSVHSYLVASQSFHHSVTNNAPPTQAPQPGWYTDDTSIYRGVKPSWLKKNIPNRMIITRWSCYHGDRPGEGTKLWCDFFCLWTRVHTRTHGRQYHTYEIKKL